MTPTPPRKPTNDAPLQPQEPDFAEAPESPLPMRAIVVCFLAGVLLFSGAMALVVAWFHDPNIRTPLPDSPATGILSPLSDTGRNGVSPAEAVANALLSETQRTVRVFFTTDGRKLQPQPLTPPKTLLSDHDRLVFALRELVAGPATEDFYPTVPSGTRLRAAYIHGETAVIDLSEGFRSQPIGGPMAELLCAQAIVHTAVDNVKPVRKVRILVEGQSVPILWDQVDLASPLNADISLLR